MRYVIAACLLLAAPCGPAQASPARDAKACTVLARLAPGWTQLYLAYPAARTNEALQIMKLLTDDALTDDDLALLRPLAEWADTHRQIRGDDAPKVFLSDCLADERWLPKR